MAIAVPNDYNRSRARERTTLPPGRNQDRQALAKWIDVVLRCFWTIGIVSSLTSQIMDLPVEDSDSCFKISSAVRNIHFG